MNTNIKLQKMSPSITEKSLKDVAKFNQYTFLVNKDINKIEIGKLISKIYDVKVLQVRVVNLRAKRKVNPKNRKILMRIRSKKAIVTLKKGDSIKEFNLNPETK